MKDLILIELASNRFVVIKVHNRRVESIACESIFYGSHRQSLERTIGKQKVKQLQLEIIWGIKMRARNANATKQSSLTSLPSSSS